MFLKMSAKKKYQESARKAEIASGNVAVYSPYDQTAVPSSAMIEHINKMLAILEETGVDVREYRERGNWKTRYSEGRQIIQALHKLEKEYGIDYDDWETVYVNLCKHKRKKTKIKYKTRYRLGCPKGYEYIGTLRQEYIKKGERDENESRERDSNKLQPRREGSVCVHVQPEADREVKGSGRELSE